MANRRIYQLNDGTIIVTHEDREIAIDESSFTEPYKVTVESFQNYPYLYGTTVTQGTAKTVDVGITTYDKWLTIHIAAYRGSETRKWEKLLYYNGSTITEVNSPRFGGSGNMGLTFSYGVSGSAIQMTMTADAHANDTTVTFMKIANLSSIISKTL